MFNDTFLKACRQEPTGYIPVWFMRQAGRSLPGYQKLRQKYDFMTLMTNPELAAQISLEPVETLNVDAAILFADIMLLPIALGVDLNYIDGVGPVIEKPISSFKDIAKLQPFDSNKIEYMTKTIKTLRGELKVPLIGFSAAPYTLASYLIEGQTSRNWLKTKRYMMEKTDSWNNLMEILADAVISYLSAQIDAGVQTVQLFDSWVGILSPSDYRDYVLPHSQKIFTALRKKKVPRIHFGTDTGGMIKDFASVDAEVIGLDWRTDIHMAKKLIGNKAIQGNLDPTVLLTSSATIKHKVDRLLITLPSRTGFIFNLGHGVLPETEDSKLKELVEYIHEC